MTQAEQERAADDLMVLVTSLANGHGLDGPAGQVFAEVISDIPRAGALLGECAGLLAASAMRHPDGVDAGVAAVRAALDAGVGRA